jgi:DNA-binding Xre family transcriptional regulator
MSTTKNVLEAKMQMSKLKRVRLLQGMTQVDLTKKTGIYYTTISRIENGVVKPTPVQMERICKALRCEPQDIFEE